MNIRLIPCPDCGAPAEVKRGCYSGMLQVYSYVHCTNTACLLNRHTLHFTASSAEESDRRASQSWNERYADTLALETENISSIVTHVAAGSSPLKGLHA